MAGSPTTHSIEETCESRWREGVGTLQLQVTKDVQTRELMNTATELLGIQFSIDKPVYREE